MRETLQILAFSLIAGITGVQAQSPAAPQGPAGQSSQIQTAGSGANANNGQKPIAQPSRDNSGPPYSDCYMKCINAGNPGDYCRANSKNYCY
jgi:hypothetical protein